jgi:hypothetical protein
MYAVYRPCCHQALDIFGGAHALIGNDFNGGMIAHRAEGGVVTSGGRLLQPGNPQRR